MPLALPDPPGSFLPGSPLDLVVCQLRFEVKPEVSAPQVGLGIHQAVGGDTGPYPRLDQLRGQAVNVEIGAQGGASVTENAPTSGWRYQSSDALWIVSLMPDHIALESKQYPGWSDFSTRFADLVDVVAEHLSPAVEQRLGLRYVDRISEVEAHTPSEWTQYLQEPVLGLAAHEVLGEHVANARQQLLLDLGGSYGCVLTHGFLPRDDGRLDYLLDYDVFREGGRAFSVDAIHETLETLHSDAGKLFHASITPTLYEIFGQEA